MSNLTFTRVPHFIVGTALTSGSCKRSSCKHCTYSKLALRSYFEAEGGQGTCFSGSDFSFSLNLPLSHTHSLSSFVPAPNPRRMYTRRRSINLPWDVYLTPLIRDQLVHTSAFLSVSPFVSFHARKYHSWGYSKRVDCLWLCSEWREVKEYSPTWCQWSSSSLHHHLRSAGDGYIDFEEFSAILTRHSDLSPYRDFQGILQNFVPLPSLTHSDCWTHGAEWGCGFENDLCSFEKRLFMWYVWIIL